MEQKLLDVRPLQAADLKIVPALGKWRYHLSLLRYRDWSVQSGVFLLGAFFADDLFSHSLLFIASSLLLSCLCLAYGYSLNEFFDELKDKLSDQPRVLAELYRFIYLLLAGSLVISWLISIATFAVVALIGVTVWLHSSPPFRLKRHLFWRLFLNSLGFGLFFAAGAGLDKHLSVAEMLMSGFIFGLYLPLELVHVAAHKEADQTRGLPTFAVVHGERATLALAIILLLGLVFYSGVLWYLKFLSLAFTAWSAFHLLALALLCLMSFYKRNNGVERYAKLRFQTKIICAIYGAGMLAILARASRLT